MALFFGIILLQAESISGVTPMGLRAGRGRLDCHDKETQMQVTVSSEDWNIGMSVSPLTTEIRAENRCMWETELKEIGLHFPSHWVQWT